MMQFVFRIMTIMREPTHFCAYPFDFQKTEILAGTRVPPFSQRRTTHRLGMANMVMKVLSFAAVFGLSTCSFLVKKVFLPSRNISSSRFVQVTVGDHTVNCPLLQVPGLENKSLHYISNSLTSLQPSDCHDEDNTASETRFFKIDNNLFLVSEGNRPKEQKSSLFPKRFQLKLNALKALSNKLEISKSMTRESLGLSATCAKMRLTAHGANIVELKLPTFWERFRDRYFTPLPLFQYLIRFLLVLEEPVFIPIFMLLSELGIGAWHIRQSISAARLLYEGHSSGSLDFAPTDTVICKRDGAWSHVNVSALVMGDVIQLRPGKVCDRALVYALMHP